ncbi:MAG: DUF4440 domain-containing protein [Thalassobaculaceae bacterium]|nr:DUF4440 domain-containing protein [Thalassobaculaceae bacterium]
MQQFLDYMGSFRGGRRFIALDEERALLQTATSRFGLALDDARSALLVGARQSDLILESDVADEVTAFLATRLRKGDRIARTDFRAATDFFTARTGNIVSPGEAEQRVRQLVTRAGWSPAASGWLWRSSKWFDRIPNPAPRPGAQRPAAFDAADGAAMPAPVAGAMQATVGNPIATLRAWETALRSRNVEQIIALYTPDALLLATAEDTPLIGPAQIRTYFARLASYEGLSVSFQQELQRLTAERATLVSGLYTFTWLDPQTGVPVVTPARYTFAIRNTGGQGRISMHHSSHIPGNYPGSSEI